MSRVPRLLSGVVCTLSVALVIACTDSTTGPGSGTPEFTGGRPPRNNFVRCEPQPHATVSAKIGPRGGTVRAGRHTLKIPAGALNETMRIYMEAPSDTLNYVVLGPEGLQFDPRYPASLSLSYKNCPGITSQPLLDVAYVDNSMTTVLENIEPVSTDTLNQAVYVDLEHFSKYVLSRRYAVAY